LFPPTKDAAQARLNAVAPSAYGSSRNSLDGAVSQLSPYITHGFLSLPEVLRAVCAKQALSLQDKWIFQLSWREFFQEVWQHRQSGIFQSLHSGILPEQAYTQTLPGDVLQARTGVPVIDQAVRTLYTTGYLHNHARLWLASYMIHWRKVHWRAAADWLYAHLLDGDLASNHLSWQWVAGTGSTKPYLFNADNVARYAPLQWHSPGSAVDASYESLMQMARTPPSARISSQADEAAQAADVIPNVKLYNRPPPACPLTALTPVEIAQWSQAVAGQDVWLIHPWALQEPHCNRVKLGILIEEFHTTWAWSAARWHFVGTRMAELSPMRGLLSKKKLASILQHARSIHTQTNLHIKPYLPPSVQQQEAPRLFAPVDTLCNSFSQWRKLAMQNTASIDALLASHGGQSEHSLDQLKPFAPSLHNHEFFVTQESPPHEHLDNAPSGPDHRRTRWHRP
jgi:deoxyribodipyrimidine photo-lyase